ncbi:MAG TPA: hypothetical protein VLI93_01475 [Acetobacteraceae bacterium]|nr:hypothetical protein [Acetobacteraceae bacterium]
MKMLKRWNDAGMLNKVAEITIYFWIIKILATTVGETAADMVSVTLNLGLTITSYIMTGVFVAALITQIRYRKYVPWIYWLTVVLISVVGTLISDNLVDNLGISLETTTIAFGVALLATFGWWYAKERTLSIHTIYTTRRESFYWAAILFTFALGTSGGDLAAEGLKLGYGEAALIFAGLIGVVTFAYYVLRLNAVVAFWIAYILTRPLGASFGDLLSQPVADGGLGLGTVITSTIFLATIVFLVVHLTRRRNSKAPLMLEPGSA